MIDEIWNLLLAEMGGVFLPPVCSAALPVAGWTLLCSGAAAKGRVALGPVQLLNIRAVSSTLAQVLGD